jgi:hypothetical protein
MNYPNWRFFIVASFLFFSGSVLADAYYLVELKLSWHSMNTFSEKVDLDIFMSFYKSEFINEKDLELSLKNINAIYSDKENYSEDLKNLGYKSQYPYNNLHVGSVNCREFDLRAFNGANENLEKNLKGFSNSNPGFRFEKQADQNLYFISKLDQTKLVLSRSSTKMLVLEKQILLTNKKFSQTILFLRRDDNDSLIPILLLDQTFVSSDKRSVFQKKRDLNFLSNSEGSLNNRINKFYLVFYPDKENLGVVDLFKINRDYGFTLMTNSEFSNSFSIKDEKVEDKTSYFTLCFNYSFLKHESGSYDYDINEGGLEQADPYINCYIKKSFKWNETWKIRALRTRTRRIWGLDDFLKGKHRIADIQLDNFFPTLENNNKVVINFISPEMTRKNFSIQYVGISQMELQIDKLNLVQWKLETFLKRIQFKGLKLEESPLCLVPKSEKIQLLDKYISESYNALRIADKIDKCPEEKTDDSICQFLKFSQKEITKSSGVKKLSPDMSEIQILQSVLLLYAYLNKKSNSPPNSSNTNNLLNGLAEQTKLGEYCNWYFYESEGNLIENFLSVSNSKISVVRLKKVLNSFGRLANETPSSPRNSNNLSKLQDFVELVLIDKNDSKSILNQKEFNKSKENFLQVLKIKEHIEINQRECKNDFTSIISDIIAVLNAFYLVNLKIDCDFIKMNFYKFGPELRIFFESLIDTERLSFKSSSFKLVEKYLYFKSFLEIFEFNSSSQPQTDDWHTLAKSFIFAKQILKDLKLKSDLNMLLIREISHRNNPIYHEKGHALIFQSNKSQFCLTSGRDSSPKNIFIESTFDFQSEEQHSQLHSMFLLKIFEKKAFSVLGEIDLNDFQINNSDDCHTADHQSHFNLSVKAYKTDQRRLLKI